MQCMQQVQAQSLQCTPFGGITTASFGLAILVALPGAHSLCPTVVPTMQPTGAYQLAQPHHHLGPRPRRFPISQLHAMIPHRQPAMNLPSQAQIPDDRQPTTGDQALNPFLSKTPYRPSPLLSKTPSRPRPVPHKTHFYTRRILQHCALADRQPTFSFESRCVQRSSLPQIRQVESYLN